MAWIELHQSVFDHPKTLDAAERLHRQPVAIVGHLAALWAWALDACPEGGPLAARDIKAGAQWTGKADVLAEALAGARYLDRDDDGRYFIHNWDDYAGKLLARRESNRQRVRDHRKRLRNAPVSITSPLRNGATVPNPTVPNPTVPPEERSTDLRNVSADKSLLAVAVAFYESEIGTITPFVAQSLDEWIQDDAPEAAFQYAFGQAAAQNKRSWSYVEGILKRLRDAKWPADPSSVGRKSRAGSREVASASADFLPGSGTMGKAGEVVW